MDPKLFRNPDNKFRPLQIIHGFDLLLENREKKLVGTADTEPKKYDLCAVQKNLKRLRKMGVDDLVLTSANANILYKHVYRDGKHVYFLTNASSESQGIEATFAVRGKPSIWYPANGRISKISSETASGSTTIGLTLRGYEGVFVVF